MQMYDIDFKVKYYQIENELLNKVQLGEDGYTKDDIYIVCEKLYLDEFCSVFNATNPYDDNIDKGLQYVLQIMSKNPEFVSLLSEIKTLLMFDKSDTTDYTEEEKESYNYNANYIIMLAAFSFPIFHIMHKCVCQQIKTGKLSLESLDILKEGIIKYISSRNNKE
jgi:hypothetical protein